MIDLKIPVSDKLIYFMQTRKRYQILRGGRSSGKTKHIIFKLLMRALQKPKQKILCAREFQSSIKESTHTEIASVIDEWGLDKIFKVTDREITAINGSYFIFKGLVKDINKIKGISDINVVFIEEAETVPKNIWDVLIPTIRAQGSEIIVAFNPKDELSDTYKRFVLDDIPEHLIFRQEINYYDNPFNSETILEEIKWLREHDYARYEHIYLGKLLKISEAVIFKGRFKILDIPLELRDNGSYYHDDKFVKMFYGMDFGFSTDQAAMPQMCFLDADTLYIYNEIYELEMLITDYIKKIDETFGLDALRSKWGADSARPDSIAQLRKGDRFASLDIEGAPKPKGSVESGIEWLKTKTIIIHPRCVHTAFEFYNYKYEVDKNTGAITTDIADKHNHIIDAIRYGLWKFIAAAGRRPPSRVRQSLKDKLGINNKLGVNRHAY